MSFANPKFLYFLLFALIPIFLYLFNLQKVIRVDFSNVAILEDFKKETSNRFQLKRLLIMLSRVLAIFFIVMAFAQPSFKAITKNINVHHVIFLDNSLSMTRKIEDALLLDKAKSILENTVVAKKGDKFSFITHQDLEINRDYYSKKDLLKAVSKVKPSTGNIYHIKISGLLRKKESDLPKRYYYISDFQSSSYTLEEFKNSRKDTSQELILARLDAETNNCFIDSIWMDSKYLVSGTTVKVGFRIQNQSKSEKELVVKCLVEGNQLGTKSVKIPELSAKNSEIEFQLSKKGFNALELRVDDPFVEFDNAYHFVLESNRNIKIVIIKGNEKSYFQQAYKNEALFLTKVFEESKLNSSELAQNDLIVLDGISNYKNLPLLQLKDFVKKGGHLCIVPQTNVAVLEVTKFLSDLGVGASVTKPTLAEKQEIDFAGLIQNNWFKNQFQKTELKMQSIYFQPVLNQNGGQSIIKSRKGEAFLSQYSTREKGTVFLFSVPLLDEATNFMKHSLFVITSYEMAMNSASINSNISFDIGKKEMILTGLNPEKGRRYTLQSTKNQYTPQQQVNGDNLIYTLSNDEQAGIYDVKSQKDTLTKVALNFSRKESYFTALDLSSLEKSKNIQVQNWDATKPHLAEDSEIGLGKWKWWVLLALVCLLVETALIRLYK